MRLTERKVAAILRQHSYKLTPQRRVVIQAIASNQDHLTPTAIYERVHQHHPNIGFVTIYRTLEILAQLGLICELHAGGSCRSYTISAPGHHHHLICERCSAIIDVDESLFLPIQQTLFKEYSFRANINHFAIFGRCINCQT